ncbi:hypothetical protein FIBSPDRAFT_926069, partial [Athelia psychrophila]
MLNGDKIGLRDQADQLVVHQLTGILTNSLAEGKRLGEIETCSWNTTQFWAAGKMWTWCIVAKGGKVAHTRQHGRAPTTNAVVHQAHNHFKACPATRTTDSERRPYSRRLSASSAPPDFWNVDRRRCTRAQSLADIQPMRQHQQMQLSATICVLPQDKLEPSPRLHLAIDRALRHARL